MVAKCNRLCYNADMLTKSDASLLLSIANTRLRDDDLTLDALAGDLSMTEEELCAALASIGYRYDGAARQFKPE